MVVDSDGAEATLRPKELVLATGMSGRANLPKFKGMDRFRGEQHHSSHHPGPDAYRGKKAVVIGSNNSAHDICATLWEGEVDVTMLQLSSTHIVKSNTLMELALGGLYSEAAVRGGMNTNKADMIFASLPYAILHEFQIPVYAQMKETDADFYAGLEKAGFLLGWGDDQSGLFMKDLRRGSGYYIDVGASHPIIDGKIKLAHGAVAEITEDAVVLEDGTRLPADVIVYATGYGSMNGWEADLIGQGVADKVGKCWGLAWVCHHQRPRPVGRRRSQHVEAYAARGFVVSRRQPAPIAALFAVFVVAAKGPDGRYCSASLWLASGASHVLKWGFVTKACAKRGAFWLSATLDLRWRISQHALALGHWPSRQYCSLARQILGKAAFAFGSVWPMPYCWLHPSCRAEGLRSLAEL